MGSAKMMKAKRMNGVKALSIVAALVASTGCASQLQPIEEGDTGGEEAAMPQHVAEAFERACGNATCHGGAVSPSLTAATAPAIVGMDATTASLPLVVLGDLQASYIAIKVLPDAALDDPGARVGGIMPPAGNEFEQADVDTILGWIASSTPSGGGSGGDDDDDDADTGPDDDDDDDDDDDSVPTQACGIADVVPDIDSPVEMGNEAGMIPEQIGLIIENNCGCHFATSMDDLIEGAPFTQPAPPDGMGSDLATLAGIMANADGIAARIVDSPSAMPPPYYCSPLHVQALTQADFDALTAWFDMGTPDGATWTPM